MSFSPPPSFQFVHGGLSEHSAKIYSVISRLSSPKLMPKDLHNEIIRIGLPLGIDQNDLAHAYYSYYWSKKLHNAIEVPGLTERGDEHDDMTCNIDFEPNYLMLPNVFSQALRTISPKEVMGQYYHHAVICHSDFDHFLEHVNKTLKTYFETPAYALSHDMHQLLNGIIKCICLRVLSSSSYYYAHKEKPRGVRPEIGHLLDFYVMTNLIHEWNEVSYGQHIHMIRKYDAFKKFIVKILNLGPSFMSTHYFTFDQVTRNLELVLFDNLYREPAYFACESFPICITDLKRNISSDDILRSIQSQSYKKLGPKTIVENGLTLLQFLVNRIKQDNVLSRDTKDDYDFAHVVFQMTGEAIQQLPGATHQREFTELENEMLTIIRFRKSKREKVEPLRMHSSQALIISPRMFRAGRNAPLLRASPPPVHGSSLRVSPPPVHHGSHHGSVSNSPPPYHHGSHHGSVSNSPPPYRHGSRHGSHHESHTGSRHGSQHESHTGSQHTRKRPRGRGGARFKKSISKSKTKRSKNLKQT